MKSRNVIKADIKEITLELWNLNVKIGDLENLKERGTIERERKGLVREEKSIYFYC